MDDGKRWWQKIYFPHSCLAPAIAKLLQRQKTAKFPRERAWIEVDLAALEHNMDLLTSLLPERCRIMAVVKADAYGLGAVPISLRLAKRGIKFFCTASLAEAIELRKAHIKGDILILGYTHPRDFPLLYRYNLIQTVLDYAYARELNSSFRPLRVHLKIDTGMHRLGEKEENFAAIRNIFDMPKLKIEGIYTHLAVADSVQSDDIDYTNSQIAKFYSVLDHLQQEGITLPPVHIQSSYGVFNYPQLCCDYARIGIALYGAIDSCYLLHTPVPQLLPIFRLRARIGLIKNIAPGEGVGYGLTYLAEKKRKIALLSIGYADGVPRCATDSMAYALIKGQKAPIIGRICMDQLMLDVTGIPEIKINDIATLIGQDQQQNISPADFANWNNTIPNEILSRLGQRLPRIYLN